MRILRKCILISVLFFIQISYAEDIQKFQVQNNDTIAAVISERELSRITFEGDVIKQIYSNGGELQSELVERDLYIKPNVIKPINFFVSTEKGSTYKFIMTPRDIPSVQVFVQNMHFNQQDLSNEFKYTGESVLRSKLSQIISSSMSGDGGFKFKKKDIHKKVRAEKDMLMNLDSEWHGEGLKALKYFIQNNSESTKHLNRSDYLKGNILAVYVSKETMKPQEEATLITIERGKP